ncbi:hypothetical protein HMPREF9318_01601 [Streptococcus urinalis FB127-CNA-2]|uniref:Acyltransferase n=1 Tax=Streptococcus urinalis 2285-97 TaxID=764291 RepID=G5KFI0_9STRE|nr:acyltransferase family protein [Streptococcus urinalis]EHJ57045.1 acyltransferase [Streptococcus urinalis 2285-97]EKS19205.1 hypothetical protein HMPREF9318_01601 [Streptococcus urinalis FB127-CNA-2]VEF33073.1 acyltransferase [Streptococcus urinalis]
MRVKWFSFIRVTGLLLVLLYHFFKHAFPGGFIGVDIFFTFSGYLITALLIDEYTKKKTIDIIGFLRRRFYRIVPPVIIMVLVTMPFTFLVRRDFIAGIGAQIAAAIGFTTNFYEILTGGNYESQFIPHLFVHTWSLAIEVHFYIIWALIVWLLARKHYEPTKFRGYVFLASTGIFAISFLTMFIRAFLVNNFSLIYFSTLAHSFPFFLGAMFATMTGIKETTTRFQKNVKHWQTKQVLSVMIGSFLMLLILTLVLDFNQLITYLFGFVLASFFASIMIYAARVLHEKTPNSKEPFVITYIADISYGVYLFHWPFYIIFSQLGPNWIAVILTVLCSFIFSTLSFYVIEPLIAGKEPHLFGLSLDLKPYLKWLYTLAGVLAVITLLTGFLAPSVGKFENELLASSLEQARNSINRTHTLAAGDANALSDITIIGDSVALRSSSAFSSIMPEAQLDAAVSRNFSEAYDIFSNHITSNTLSQTVVVAIGVNSLDHYKTDLNAFIKKLPKGHRLVFVSPYNSKNITQVAEARDYEIKLAQKYSYVTVADWYKVAVENPDIWDGTDGVHYSDSTTKGATLYVDTVQSAVRKVAKQNPK